jgi:hypothetical protein
MEGEGRIAPGVAKGRSLQVLFVLSCTGPSAYLHMARLAVASLRISDPARPIILLCDRETAQDLAFIATDLRDQVDRMVVLDTPAGDAAYRSRFVKTSMRAAVADDFLFLDLDVLVRGSLEGVLDLDADIAAAVNFARPVLARQIDPMNEEILATMGWRRSEQHYLNTGAILFRDTPAAHAACADWHRKWADCHTRTGRHYDQPAFNAMLAELEIRTAILPNRYNAQLRPSPGTVPDALVWHYYMSSRLDRTTAFGLEVERLMRGGSFSLRRVKALVQAPHPWRRTHPLDDLVSRRVIASGGYMKDLEELWFGGQRWQAAMEYRRRHGTSELRTWLRDRLPQGLLRAYRKLR